MGLIRKSVTFPLAYALRHKSFFAALQLFWADLQNMKLSDFSETIAFLFLSVQRKNKAISKSSKTDAAGE